MCKHYFKVGNRCMLSIRVAFHEGYPLFGTRGAVSMTQWERLRFQTSLTITKWSGTVGLSLS